MVRRVLLASLALVGCSDDANKDASVDIDNGSCGSDLRFTGEYLDWDSHTSFCGIKDAMLQVSGGPIDSTAPNGRFDLCVPGTATTTELMITQPTGPSGCTQPPSTYPMPTMFYAIRAVIRGGGFFSGRSITANRRPAFFTQIGQTYDPTKAIVFVHVHGATPRAITLANAHGAPQVITGNTWAAGDTAADVMFPNVDVGTGKVKLSIAGGGTGEGDVPIAAGTITNVAVIAN